MAENSQPILTAVFVDYDNIYLSLKRRSEDAAKRFAKDAAGWIKEIESGRLLTATNSPAAERPRRIVLNRCYGNPVPRRNQNDNSTDMNSFPFVRHHFLRAGFEVIDCPPLTAQLKNSSDIKMVMDVRDFLTHDTRFEEFIILSGDADFTPVLHRLRAHARRTIIFANDYTAQPYTAICDGEVKEASLLAFLLADKIPQQPEQPQITAETPPLERMRTEIIAAVTNAVRSAGGPVPLEALAERTTRVLGHERTVGTSWAGAGSFLELLRQGLPEDVRLTDQPPYLAFEARRGIPNAQPINVVETRQIERAETRIEPTLPVPAQQRTLPSPQPALQQPVPQQPAPQPQPQVAAMAPPQAAPLRPVRPAAAAPIQPTLQATPAPAPQQPAQPQSRQTDVATAIQQSIARIHDACQAPPLSPPEYRALFELMAKEINDAGLQGAQTLNNIAVRAHEVGVKLAADDIRFVWDVVSEADPWFEQGASAQLFAGRFRNFVVARCRSQGLTLSADELDLIEAWFAGSGQVAPQSIRVPAGSVPVGQQARQAAPAQANIWNEAPPAAQAAAGGGQGAEEFPKILRTRLRG